MKAKYIALLPVLLILSGCATSTQVQQMIDANNQKLASEQLKPEFDRISEQLEDLAARVRTAEAAAARSEETVQSLSLALNKTQGDIGLMSKKITKLAEQTESQQSLVDRQNEAIINIFRKQLADLQETIRQLEGEPTEPAE